MTLNGLVPYKHDGQSFDPDLGPNMRYGGVQVPREHLGILGDWVQRLHLFEEGA